LAQYRKTRDQIIARMIERFGPLREPAAVP
jgi:hypothetical protein